MTNQPEDSPRSPSELPTTLAKSSVSSAPQTFRNPFQERDPAEVWRELLENAGPPISKEEAIKRMIKGPKK